ncbi:acetate/propionate family kinase [Pseudohaliea sp.]|uniref:acetate/propionate family kinase n=1 Tax=Pseudohaliea sp. TaxID=2740289 RepID=UPI0032EB1B30
MTILVVNAGSSSLKFALYDRAADHRSLRGEIAPLGDSTPALLCLEDCPKAEHSEVRVGALDDAAAGVEWLAHNLEALSGGGVTAVGHRVVHGGSDFAAATPIDEQVLAKLHKLDPHAPLHNPSSRRAILAASRLFPGAMQVAVFDTAFHQSMPAVARHYALPTELARDFDIRRFGFHGISHQYLARRTAEILARPAADLRLITLHLGNGASAAAIRGGHSIDTSMGFTPLEGLVMGTRCGDLDPAVPLFLHTQGGLPVDAIDDLLNRRSGLRGLAGTHDMREVERRRQHGDEAAALAFELFCYRARKYLGSFLAVLGGADAIVFSGGIGQHSAAVRRAICDDLSGLGIVLDVNKNETAEPDALVHADESAVAIALLATDEEQEIARQVSTLLPLEPS